MNEITAAIKAKAFDYAKALYTHAKDEDIRESSQCEAYTCGGEDAIEHLFKKNDFLKWSYDKIAQFNWRENTWIVKTSSGLDYNKEYTTEQLLLKYMEDNKL